MRLFISGFLAAVLLMLAAGMAVIHTGAYDVAADEDDTIVERWILRTAMGRSVKAHARSIVQPEKFNDEHHVRHGVRSYDEMCVQCHGGPGKKRGEIGLGLSPQPPDLSGVARRWDAAELFWILKHGIRATGMPAFGKTHTEEQLWDLVALVQTLPELNPEQYKALEAAVGSEPDHGPHEHPHHQHDH